LCVLYQCTGSGNLLEARGSRGSWRSRGELGLAAVLVRLTWTPRCRVLANGWPGVVAVGSPRMALRHAPTVQLP